MQGEDKVGRARVFLRRVFLSVHVHAHSRVIHLSE